MIENRMVNDDAWKSLKRSKSEEYYDDMPDYLDEGDDD